ncbi:hypothetical protein RPE78_03010 [Thioclava litoralis]|uniref:Uncharacterized protein n=1 Tax=Thioclava litoralis TaxID=3076557 RepID=A0ABZ1E2E5_9RHOB|nr:hypothetical protein RPE78_03010 [Thioclava sp. FTW29]
MRKPATFMLLSLFLLLLPACWSDAEVLDNLKYELASTAGWPIVAVIDSPLFISSQGNLEPAPIYRSGGYEGTIASLPIKNVLKDSSVTTQVTFKVTWYEVVTGNIYSASLDIDMRELKPDPITPDYGALIFRISADGILQAVTYDETYPPSATPSPPIILDQSCGKAADFERGLKVSDFQENLDHPIVKNAFQYQIPTKNIPAHCN